MFKIKCIIGRAIHRTNFDTREIDKLTEEEKGLALQYLNIYTIVDERDTERINNLITYLKDGTIVEDVNMTVDIDFGSVILIDWENRKDRYTVLNNLSKLCTVVAYTHVKDYCLEKYDIQGLFEVVSVDSSVEQAVDYRIYADISKLKAKGVNKIVIVSGDQGYRRFCDALGIECTLVTGADLLRVKSPKISDYREIIKEGYSKENVAVIGEERLFDLIDASTFSEELESVKEDFFEMQEKYSKLCNSMKTTSQTSTELTSQLEMFYNASNVNSAESIVKDLPDGLVKDIAKKLLGFKVEVKESSITEEVDLSELIQVGIGGIAKSADVQSFTSNEWEDLSNDPILDSPNYSYKPLDLDSYKDFIDIDIELNKILPVNTNETAYGYIRRLSLLDLDELQLMCKEVGLPYSEDDSKYELACSLNYHPIKARNRHYRRAGLKPPHNVLV